jgi:WD40 repeat protein
MANPVVFDAHGRHAQAVHFMQKSKMLISAGQDAKVRLWSVPGFKSVAAFEGHANSVNTISLSPSEKHLATGSTDGTVRIWSFPEGNCLAVLKNQLNAQFSPDGKQLATIAKNGAVVVWQMPEAIEIAEIKKLDQRLFSLAFAANARHLLVGGGSGIHVLELPDGEKISTLKVHAPAVGALRISPNGKLLASAGADGTARVFAVNDWREKLCLKLKAAGVYQLAFSPDSRAIAVSMDGVIPIYNVMDGRLEREITVGLKGVYGVSISPDGKYLANAAADGKIRVWELSR